MIQHYSNTNNPIDFPEQSLMYRLRKRAEIRRQIANRKSVQENKPDRIADLLEEAADEISSLKMQVIGLKALVDIERNMKMNATNGVE